MLSVCFITELHPQLPPLKILFAFSCLFLFCFEITRFYSVASSDLELAVQTHLASDSKKLPASASPVVRCLILRLSNTSQLFLQPASVQGRSHSLISSEGSLKRQFVLQTACSIRLLGSRGSVPHEETRTVCHVGKQELSAVGI